MDAVKVYWRDSIVKLAAWGAGILFTVAGWALFQSQMFELKRGAHDREIARAIILLIFAFGGTFIWSLALRWIHKNHLSNGVDATVLDWRAFRVYALIVSGCTWILALIAALY